MPSQHIQAHCKYLRPAENIGAFQRNVQWKIPYNLQKQLSNKLQNFNQTSRLDSYLLFAHYQRAYKQLALCPLPFQQLPRSRQCQ